ncbi:hypothetical protein GZ77_11315 [Endozoicomonas montiporae]|uniref:Uncharacterized protein n=2 Tax=Endozoicomonas montiporae TaxID=1027273 RepID=A0A081N8S9_9GAMM|nr:hypothetical protein [Endozoicomonas montiporae]AMO55238.1 hypothetical protein EZMO1_1031 [Endozoicomonas montiporae CL-33]KEQ14852.1 hypothetical protein GZ77_11315 [Endozoicomonas montiporae]
MKQDIPPKDRAEWTELVSGQHKMEKFVLQLQVDKVNKGVKSGDMTVEEAVDYLYEYFAKYPKGFTNDLRAVFKTW